MRAHSGKTTMPLWKAVASMLLVLHLLFQMKSVLQDARPELPTSARASATNRASMLSLSRSLTRSYILRQLQGYSSYQELSHNSYYVKGMNGKAPYYYTSIRYRVQGENREDVIYTYCFHFSEAGALIVAFPCG